MNVTKVIQKRPKCEIRTPTAAQAHRARSHGRGRSVPTLRSAGARRLGRPRSSRRLGPPPRRSGALSDVDTGAARAKPRRPSRLLRRPRHATASSSALSAKICAPSTGSGRRRRRRRSSRELDEVRLSAPEGRTQANRIARVCTRARRPKMNKKLPTAIASPFGSSTTSNSLGGLDQHARRCSSEAARDTTLKALSVGQKSHEYELCIK